MKLSSCFKKHFVSYSELDDHPHRYQIPRKSSGSRNFRICTVLLIFW